ncbi:TerC family protein [Desulfitobacterium sp. Sab5]|uniref:TerC family protein n=1 Tax=Desulfitobacterium nosdiversum TaxID=3375356 RepID=UPI003CF520C9
MEFLANGFFAALLSIVMIDLVLGGDNAIVIGLAARNLPQHEQKKVIFLGTLGAIVIRALTTLIAVWLLKIPGLLLAGGSFLVWMAYRLLTQEKSPDVASSATMWAAIQTIIVADAVMGLDNVLAVAGAAHGSYALVVCGLAISIPIVVWGSTLVIKALNRFPWLIQFGSAVIAYTASTMISDEPFLHSIFSVNPLLRWGLTIALITGVLWAGRRKIAQKIKAADKSIA